MAARGPQVEDGQNDQGLNVVCCVVGEESKLLVGKAKHQRSKSQREASPVLTHSPSNLFFLFGSLQFASLHSATARQEARRDGMGVGWWGLPAEPPSKGGISAALRFLHGNSSWVLLGADAWPLGT